MQEETGQALEVRNRIIGMIEVQASEILDHPHQWRVHPKNQIQALREAMTKVGQANVIIVYRSERAGGALVAIDGHNRKNKSGVERWNAIELDVTDEEADFLLATMDPISAMAVTDKAKWAALYDVLPVAPEAVQMMMDGVLGARMPDKGLAFKGGGLEDEETADGEEAVAPVPSIPQSTVRMVQLYLDNTTHPEYMRMMDALGEGLNTTSLTETTLAAVRYAYGALCDTGAEASSDDRSEDQKVNEGYYTYARPADYQESLARTQESIAALEPQGINAYEEYEKARAQVIAGDSEADAAHSVSGPVASPASPEKNVDGAGLAPRKTGNITTLHERAIGGEDSGIIGLDPATPPSPPRRQPSTYYACAACDWSASSDDFIGRYCPQCGCEVSLEQEAAR